MALDRLFTQTTPMPSNSSKTKSTNVFIDVGRKERLSSGVSLPLHW